MRRLALILLAIALGAGVTGCTKELSTPLVEQMVVDYLKSSVRVDAEVNCPEHVEMVTGNHFMCDFTYGTSGREGHMIVVQNDRYGGIQFLQGDPVDHERVEGLIDDWLGENYDLDLDVSCPDDVPPITEVSFECRAGDRTVRVRQVRGDLTFDFTLADREPEGNG